VYEAYYLRMFLQLDRVLLYNTAEVCFNERHTAYSIISSFIPLTKVRKMFVGIDASGFKSSNASSCYTNEAGIWKRYIKLSIGAEVREQAACSLKLRRGPRHDTIAFILLLQMASSITPLSINPYTIGEGY